MDQKKLLAAVDHTQLGVDCTWKDIETLCNDALHYGTACVCVPPAYVKETVAYVGGRLAVGTVVGFPNGYSTGASKAFEAREAVENGAGEIDMVIHVGALKDGRLDEVREEIKAVKAACGSKTLKVIIETCLLTDEEKKTMCRLVTEAGADFIKTSTGFSKAGANAADVALMVAHVGPGVQVKAAGGIKTLEDAQTYLGLGATRLGTSSIVKIIKGQEAGAY